LPEDFPRRFCKSYKSNLKSRPLKSEPKALDPGL
jgi:hypothetical protein